MYYIVKIYSRVQKSICSAVRPILTVVKIIIYPEQTGIHTLKFRSEWTVFWFTKGPVSSGFTVTRLIFQPIYYTKQGIPYRFGSMHTFKLHTILQENKDGEKISVRQLCHMCCVVLDNTSGRIQRVMVHTMN